MISYFNEHNGELVVYLAEQHLLLLAGPLRCLPPHRRHWHLETTGGIQYLMSFIQPVRSRIHPFRRRLTVTIYP